jgi:hypothetical protein
MKTISCISLILSASLLVACNPKSTDDDYKERLRQQLEETEKSNKDAIEQAKYQADVIANLSKQGGQPGTIYLSSALATTSAEEVIETDSRLRILQHPGIGFDGKPAAINFKEAVKIQTEADPARASVSEVSQKRTYINVDCENLDPSEYEGLMQVKMKAHKSFLEAVATKVFICGKRAIYFNLAFVNAQEIILKNVDREMKSGSVMLNMQAQTLTLVGANRLATAGTKSKSPTFFRGPSISLEILEGLSGTGSLLLETTGASYDAGVGALK